VVRQSASKQKDRGDPFARCFETQLSRLKRGPSYRSAHNGVVRRGGCASIECGMPTDNTTARAESERAGALEATMTPGALLPASDRPCTSAGRHAELSSGRARRAMILTYR